MRNQSIEIIISTVWLARDELNVKSAMLVVEGA